MTLKNLGLAQVGGASLLVDAEVARLAERQGYHVEVPTPAGAPANATSSKMSAGAAGLITTAFVELNFNGSVVLSRGPSSVIGQKRPYNLLIFDRAKLIAFSKSDYQPQDGDIIVGEHHSAPGPSTLRQQPKNCVLVLQHRDAWCVVEAPGFQPLSLWNWLEGERTIDVYRLQASLQEQFVHRLKEATTNANNPRTPKATVSPFATSEWVVQTLKQSGAGRLPKPLTAAELVATLPIYKKSPQAAAFSSTQTYVPPEQLVSSGALQPVYPPR